MKKYFARLTPPERRFVVIVALLFFFVINLVWVWPHFSDWSILENRLNGARAKVKEYELVIEQAERLKPELARMEGEGMTVPAEDQAIEFVRTIQLQAQQTGVGITSFGHQTTRTNQFFDEKTQTIAGISDEKQLVDFLYNLGSGNSLIRVRALSVRPDQSRQRLTSNITLVASYQKAGSPRAATAAAKVAPAPKAPPAVKTVPTPFKVSPAPVKAGDLKPATPKKK